MKERTSIAPEKPSGTTAAQTAAPVLYTLSALHARFGAAPSSELAARLAQAPVGALVTEGQRLTTARLVREAPGVISAAMTIVAQLGPEQRDLLPALDGGFFRAAVTVIRTCDQKGESRGVAVDSAARLTRDNRAMRRALAKRAKAQRSIVYAAANALAGADPARKERLDAAWGRGEAPEHLARSLAELTELLREFVADARAKKVSTAVTDAWIDRQAALAAELEQVAVRADARAAVGEVAQGDVAWWRGAALWFLRQMADMIDAAHEVDLRVPKLPLGNLRTVVRRPRAAKKKPAAKKPDAPEAKKPDASAPDASKPA
jgi:hypothetical protein